MWNYPWGHKFVVTNKLIITHSYSIFLLYGADCESNEMRMISNVNVNEMKKNTILFYKSLIEAD